MCALFSAWDFAYGQNDYIVKLTGDTVYGHINYVSIKKVRSGNQKFKSKDREVKRFFTARRSGYYDLIKFPFEWLHCNEAIYLRRLPHDRIKIYHESRQSQELGPGFIGTSYASVFAISKGNNLM